MPTLLVATTVAAEEEEEEVVMLVPPLLLLLVKLLFSCFIFISEVSVALVCVVVVTVKGSFNKWGSVGFGEVLKYGCFNAYY